MTREHDQQCTSRQEDWAALWLAVRTWGRIGHEVKNVFREEWRRITRKCPK